MAALAALGCSQHTLTTGFIKMKTKVRDLLWPESPFVIVNRVILYPMSGMTITTTTVQLIGYSNHSPWLIGCVYVDGNWVFRDQGGDIY